MPDDFDKTEPATPRKLQKARERGQVGKSTDLNSAFMLFVAIGFLYLFGFSIVRMSLEATSELLGGFNGIDLIQDNMTSYSMAAILFVMKGILPFLLVMLAAGIFINVFQVGFVVSLEAIAPDLAKLNPITGLQNKLSMRTLVKALMDLGKVALISWVAYAVISRQWAKIFMTTGQDLNQSVGVLSDSFFELAFYMLLVLILLAISDFAYQKWQFAKNLMMSRQELKDELKDYEGDPKIKHRRRQVQLQMARQRMMRDVKQADVVITNPTHLSVALKYDEKAMAAPVVVAKGAGLIALRIRELAVENEVPIVEDKWLARALFSSAEVGDVVPQKLFKAVAKILAYVYELKTRKERRAAAAGAAAAAGV